jgi:hypothetical protein
MAMNCPHGWTQIDPDTECGACSRERDAKIVQLGRDIAQRALDHLRLTGNCLLCSRLVDNGTPTGRGGGYHERGCPLGALEVVLRPSPRSLHDHDEGPR